VGIGSAFLPVTLAVVFGTCAAYLVKIFESVREG
jgi:hypothetical protein